MFRAFSILPRRRGALTAAAGLMLGLLVVTVIPAGPAAAARLCGAPVTSVIACENALTASAASNPLTPSAVPPVSFVQQVTGHGLGTTRSVTLPSAITLDDRVIVEVGIWASGHPTISSVTDSAGNTYTDVARFVASDGTEQTVWTAPITAGGGTKPTITATATGSADIGVAALEYAGLSNAASTGAVDVSKTATGTTTSATTVFSGATAATSTNGLAMGFYADSGFGTTPTPSSGFTGRASISGAPDMDLLVEDQNAPAGATPNAGAATLANTIWLMSTVVFTAAAGTTPTAPAAPTGVTASAGNSQATVSWTAPNNGGSPITSYMVTPYVGTTAQTPTTVTGTPPAPSTTVTGLTNGTTYSFTVSATNSVGTGPESVPSNSVTPSAPTAPAAPTGVSAIAGNAEATVSWTAPANGGSPITSYTVTPYVGTNAQTPTTITGSPPATTTTVTGLTNGISYTFAVSATNSIGTGPASAASNPVTPSAAQPVAFVQQVTSHGLASNRSVVLPSAITVGNRIIVEVGIWAAVRPTISSVTDSAGNTYTNVARFVASDGTEETVWTAPVTTGGGTKPTITATATGSADIGVAALEYAGLSTTAGTGAVDVSKTATGTTTSAATVFSGVTAATSTAGLAMGFYADSGFGTTPTPSSGFTGRASISGASDMDLLVEDQNAAKGATPNAGAATSANTIWLMSTVVFTAASTTAPTAPAAPTGVTASPGNGQATVSWTAPNDGGSLITSYTVTPYIGSVAQTPTTVTGSPPATTTTVTGLTNGTAYTFTVSATNSVGTGPASAPSNSVTPAVTSQGQWGVLQTWPLVALNNIELNNGKYLLFDGWQNPTPTMVWDPVANTFTTVNAPASIFCSGVTHMPDGRILVAGGYGNLGITTTSIFNPATNAWTTAADMNLPRWYPSLLPLSDGRYVAISGNSTDANHWADTPEVYDPSTNKWTLLSAVNTSQIHEEEYPFSFLMPNGKVFAMGPSEDVSYVLDVNAQTWTPVGASGVVNGSAVTYRPGKILYSGGAPSVINTTTAQATTAVIDTTAATPTWRQTAPMNTARVYHTLTMLADGKVLAVGGEATSDQTQVTTGILSTEIWDPATETWTTGPSMSAARNYHSTAVLMPDGRVLVAGGGHEDALTDPGQYSAQIYSPGYLFKGTRPSITSATPSASYNGTITVNTPDSASISAVNLVSLGADTHQADMGQHFVPLNFTAGSGSLSVTAPNSANVAPPGDYMLFIVDGNGVPSVASMVHISAATATAPGAPTSVSATAGVGQATLSWTAPVDGGSPITSYTITPYIGTTAQTPTTITGNPPSTSATISGLTPGTAYTFTVAATNAVGTGPTSAPSNSVTPTAPTAPAAPTAVSATAGNAQATVTWIAPDNGGSPITSYTVTPYIGATAQTPKTVTGSPPAATATITGLTNGTAYTFTVSATNAVGTGPQSAASNSVTPGATQPQFVQSVTTHGQGTSTRTITLPNAITTGNRIIVEVGVWSPSNATASSVTDSAGNTYTEVLHFTGSEATEESVWTAPITAGGGTKPTITVTTTSTADTGIAGLEYSGLSLASGAAAVDVLKSATGKASSDTTVFSGATPATTVSGLAVGFYADSGFGTSPTPSTGFTARATIANQSDVDLLAEDQLVSAGATPNAGATTTTNTVWLMSTVVFKGS